MSVDAQPQPGTVLADRYELERELGRGGMGSVWRAKHLTLRSQVAIKLLSANISVKDAESRFLFEARTAAGLNNPHVVHLSDFGVHDGKPFLVMELLSGETLAARIAREGGLTPKAAAFVFAQICNGVSAAHEAGIVHRDLKPENVFLVDSGHDLLVKVLDFGVAKTVQAGGGGSVDTETGSTIGTVPYMAPEQIDDSKRVGTGADIWSLGVIAFECLLGKRPFVGESVVKLIYKVCHEPPPLPSALGPVPDGFDEWFRRATQKDPERRWASADDAATELNRICGGPLPTVTAAAPKTLPTRVRGASAAPATTGSPVWKDSASTRARRWPLFVGAGAVAVVVGVAFWATTRPSVETSSVAASAGPMDPHTTSTTRASSTATASREEDTRAAEPRPGDATGVGTTRSDDSAPTPSVHPPASNPAGSESSGVPKQRKDPRSSVPNEQAPAPRRRDPGAGVDATQPIKPSPASKPATPEPPATQTPAPEPKDPPLFL